MAVEDVERRDRPRRRDIGGLVELVLDDQFGDALQIGHSQKHDAAGLQHARELGQRHRHLVGIEMLDVVRRPDGVDRRRWDHGHREHRSHDIRLHVGIDVDPQLAPAFLAESRMQLVRVVRPAADVKDDAFGRRRRARFRRAG
jgi:hypothetical protein